MHTSKIVLNGGSDTDYVARAIYCSAKRDKLLMLASLMTDARVTSDERLAVTSKFIIEYVTDMHTAYGFNLSRVDYDTPQAMKHEQAMLNAAQALAQAIIAASNDVD